MGCLAPRRVWFYLLYPCSNHPRNSFNCFFLYFERKEIYCYELYLNRRFYRIYTFNNIRILHVVLVKATPTDFQKSIGVLSLLSSYQNCLSAGATIGRPRAFDERPYKQISAERLFSLPICGIMGLAKASLREGGGTA